MKPDSQSIPPEIEHLINQGVRDVGAVFQRLALACVKYGADTTRDSINKAVSDLFRASEEYGVSTASLESVKEAARSAGVIPPGEYGAVAQSLRLALRHFKDRPGGVSIPMLHEHITRVLGATDVQEQQLRNTLKGLLKSDHAVIVNRGMYRAGPKLLKLLGEAA